MGFFSDEQRQQIQGSKWARGSLEHIVSKFPVKLKQAMYAAAKTGRLNYKSWNNCAFNAAGKAVGVDYIASVSTAASVFDISDFVVSDFIKKWDSLNTGTGALPRILMKVLTEVGITTPPEAFHVNHADDGVVVIDAIVFKGSQTEWLEKLDTVENLSDLGITDDEISSVVDVAKVLELV